MAYLEQLLSLGFSLENFASHKLAKFKKTFVKVFGHFLFLFLFFFLSYLIFLCFSPPYFSAFFFNYYLEGGIYRDLLGF
jgi:hypothetical protein